MKRSEINATIKKMEALLDECRFKLPPYLYFTPEEWADKMNMMKSVNANLDGM